MNDQTLFDAPAVSATLSALSGRPVAHARTTDPQTSHDAAASVPTARHQRLMMRAARLHHGTAAQLRATSQRAGHAISESSARSRCKELVTDGLMYVERHQDKHAVYALTPAGRIAADQIAREARAQEAA